jgi:hypothetical protein
VTGQCDFCWHWKQMRVPHWHATSLACSGLFTLITRPHCGFGHHLVYSEHWNMLSFARRCFQCQQKSHWPVTCQMAPLYWKKMKRLGDDHFLMEMSLLVRGKQCPKCKRFVEKLGGCFYMNCNFYTWNWFHGHVSWVCLFSTYDGHFDGQLLSCNRHLCFLLKCFHRHTIP